jgi:hypothetical protein
MATLGVLTLIGEYLVHRFNHFDVLFKLVRSIDHNITLAVVNAFGKKPKIIKRRDGHSAALG